MDAFLIPLFYSAGVSGGTCKDPRASVNTITLSVLKMILDNPTFCVIAPSPGIPLDDGSISPHFSLKPPNCGWHKLFGEYGATRDGWGTV
jgi:hypothetical protein